MIKPSVIALIRRNGKLKSRLQVACDRSAPTIQRYLDDNDIMLTTAAALNVIKEELSLTEEEILETVKA